MTDEQSAAARAFERQRAALAVLNVSAPAKAVLLVLAIMANGDGEAWPPVRGPKGLAAKACLGERTVARALRELEQGRHVSTRQVAGKGSIYTVHPCQSGSPATAAGVPERQGTPAAVAPKQPGTTIPQKASPSSVGASGKKRAAEPKRGALALVPAPPPDLPADVTPELWAEFVEMRQAMAKGSKPRPWTPGAAKRIANDLHLIAADGGSPADAISASIANGWAGVRWTGDKHGKSRANHAGQPGVGRTVSAARRVLARMGRSA